MDLVALGSNFKTSSIDERERLSISPDQIPDFLKGMRGLPGVGGVVYLSTCNRVEIYASLTRGTSIAGLMNQPAYVYRNVEAFRHLVKVAIGLDSLVLGEPQILGQVKQAYLQALGAKVTGSLLNFVFQKALNIAKEIRTETGITRHPVSVSSVALMLVEQIFGEFKNLKALVVGLGEMGSQTADLLTKKGVAKLIVMNRTRKSAEIVSLEELTAVLPTVDLVITSTASETPVLSKGVLRVSLSRKEGPIVLIDLGVPRDIEPSVGGLENVYLYNVDDLKTIAEKNLAFRKKEAEVAEKMVEKALKAFESEWNKRATIACGERGRVAQLVRALH